MKYLIALILAVSLSATADVSQREARKMCADMYGQQSIKVKVKPHSYEIYMKKSKITCEIHKGY